MTENMELPEGWHWASNLHDVNRGLAVSKVWWRGSAPFMRCRVFTETDRLGQGRLYATVDVAMLSSHALNRKRERDAGNWRWRDILTLNDLPLEPVAAAVCVEMDQSEIEARLMEVAKRSGFTRLILGG